MCLLLIASATHRRESLAAGLRQAGFETEAVADVAELRDARSAKRHDVIMLDVELSGTDWPELLGRIRAESADGRILLLTPGQSVSDRVSGLNSGADDCLPKPFSFTELVARVRALQRSYRRSRSTAIRIDDLVIDSGARQVTHGGVAVALTGREFQILEYLARNAGETVPAYELEDHLYGQGNQLQSNAIASAICLLRKKLRACRGDEDLVHTERGRGYCLRSPRAS